MQIFIHHIDGTQSVVQIDENTTLETLLLAANASQCRAIYQGASISSL